MIFLVTHDTHTHFLVDASFIVSLQEEYGSRKPNFIRNPQENLRTLAEFLQIAFNRICSLLLLYSNGILEIR